MEGRYPQGIIVALIDCTDPAKEDEFNNRWYQETLIPSVQALGFVRNAKRFINVLSDSPTFQGRPKYLALWEVYRDDLQQALREIQQRVVEIRAQGKGFDAYVKFIDTLFARVGPELRTERTGRPVTGVHVISCYPTDPAREDEFNKWYNEKHIPEMLSLGTYDTAYRYKIVDPNNPVPHQFPYITIYETSMDPLEAYQKRVSIRSRWLDDPVWINLFGEHFSGGFRQIFPPLKK